MEKLTPMMLQYRSLKEQHPDKFLFFRLGDFYELFEEDALEAAKILQITLTQRHGIPMCGIPYHQLSNYAHKIIATGKKIAIAEQFTEQVDEPIAETESESQEEPSLIDDDIPSKNNIKVASKTSSKSNTKSIVERKVTNIITPGTTIDEINLSCKEKNFIFAIYLSDNVMKSEKQLSLTQSARGQVGGVLVAIDISTNEAKVEILNEEIDEQISRFVHVYQPKEIVVAELLHSQKSYQKIFKNHPRLLVSTVSGTELTEKNKTNHSDKIHAAFSDGGKWLEQFKHENFYFLKAFDWLISYLEKNYGQTIEAISPPDLEEQETMVLDQAALTQLEIFSNTFDQSKKFSLLELLDHTRTSMGGRLLREWLARPLMNSSRINDRMDALESFYQSPHLLEQVRGVLKNIFDIQRIVSKLNLKKINPRELTGLKKSLIEIDRLIRIINQEKLEIIGQGQTQNKENIQELIGLIDSTLLDEPKIDFKEGGVIRANKNPTLREYINIKENGEKLLLELEERERSLTKIVSLKIKFSENMGYFFELRKSASEKIPEYFKRRQTLTNVDRFVTEDLMALEEKILEARNHSFALEKKIFDDLVNQCQQYLSLIHELSAWVAWVDVISNLAFHSLSYRYRRPQIGDGKMMKIVGGRHPVVEQNLPDSDFIPNDITIGGDDSIIHIITGPNMSGKSTFLRQTGLILILAQIGCFVPVESAELPICDRIFTRIGSADRLAQGESTFFVEMKETAQILKYATGKSFIIMDEIGRGTSTYDGLAIAWSILEYLNRQKDKTKTLFATHYQELMKLEEQEGIKNFQVEVREENQQILFLKKVKEGVAERSYGIHVAKISGVPEEVTERANHLLEELERGGGEKKSPQSDSKAKQATTNKLVVAKELELLKTKLNTLDINQLTPIEALNALNEIKQLCQNKSD